MSKSKIKSVFNFDINGILMSTWVSKGSIGNQTYLKVLATMRGRVRKKRPELLKNKSWILPQDNRLAYNALYVKHYLAAQGIRVLKHTLYYLKRNLVRVDRWRVWAKVGGHVTKSDSSITLANGKTNETVCGGVHWRGAFDCRIFFFA